jgi:O-antigen/teichoic acid export membrane protein
MSADFAKSTVFSAAANIAMIAGGFLTTVIVARLLGPEAVGLLAYGTFIVALSMAILDMGVPGMLMRFLPDLEAEGRHDQAEALTSWFFLPYAAFTLLCGAGLVLLLDSGLFKLAGVESDGRIFVVFIAAWTVAQSLAAYYYGALKGRRRFLRLAAIMGISAIAQIAVAWLGSVFFGLIGGFAAPIAGGALAAILSLRHLSFRRDLDRTLGIRAATFAWQTWGTYFLTTIAWSRMEIFFLRHSWGDHASGLFASGLNLANLALQLPVLLTGALIPFLVLKNRSGSSEQFAGSYGTAVRLFALLVFPACFGAAAITPALLPAIFGPSFAEAVPPAMLLIAGSASMTFITIVQNYAFAVEKTGAVLRLAALGAALSVISGLTLTAAYGPMGAAAGRVGAQAIVAGGMIAYAHSLGWRTPYAALLRILAASLIAAGAAAAISTAMPDMRGIAAAILAAALIYALLIKYFRILSETEHGLIDRMAATLSLPSPLRSGFVWTAAWLRK